MIFLLSTKDKSKLTEFEDYVAQNYNQSPEFIESINWGDHSDESAVYSAYSFNEAINIHQAQNALGILILNIGNGFGCSFFLEINPASLDKNTILADGLDKATISNCPAGIFTATNTTTGETTSGEIAGAYPVYFKTNVLGTYRIKILCNGYEDFQQLIEAA